MDLVYPMSDNFDLSTESLWLRPKPGQRISDFVRELCGALREGRKPNPMGLLTLSAAVTEKSLRCSGFMADKTTLCWWCAKGAMNFKSLSRPIPAR